MTGEEGEGECKEKREERTFFSVISEKRKTKSERKHKTKSGTKQTKRKMTPPAAILFFSFSLTRTRFAANNVFQNIREVPRN